MRSYRQYGVESDIPDVERSVIKYIRELERAESNRHRMRPVRAIGRSSSFIERLLNGPREINGALKCYSFRSDEVQVCQTVE